MLLYKEDWEEAKNMLAAWWEKELKHPVLQVTSPRSTEHFSYDGWDFCRHPDEPEKAVKSFEKWCSHTFFGGASYPNLWINYGPGILSAWLGAEPVFRDTTMWFGNQQAKGTMSLAELAEADLDENNIWWKRVVKATKTAVENHYSKFIVGMTDIGGVLDVIAALRGTVETILDMRRRPEKLKTVIHNVTEVWHKCYEKLYSIMCEKGHEGTSAWMEIWCPKKWYPLQCDVSFMFSPKLFKEFVYPHIKEQCSRLDYAIYHLDGPGQIPHLNQLLKIQELDGIQWVPGAREELKGNDCGSPQWFPLYNKILENNKLLVVSIPFQKTLNFIKHYRKHSILVKTQAPSIQQAEKLLKQWKTITKQL